MSVSLSDEMRKNLAWAIGRACRNEYFTFEGFCARRDVPITHNRLKRILETEESHIEEGNLICLARAVGLEDWRELRRPWPEFVAWFKAMREAKEARRAYELARIANKPSEDVITTGLLLACISWLLAGVSIGWMIWG